MRHGETVLDRLSAAGCGGPDDTNLQPRLRLGRLVQRGVCRRRARRPDREVGHAVLEVPGPPAQHLSHALHEGRLVVWVGRQVGRLPGVGHLLRGVTARHSRPVLDSSSETRTHHVEQQRREFLRPEVHLGYAPPQS